MQETERYEFLKSFCAGGGKAGTISEKPESGMRSLPRGAGSKQAAREIAGRATVRLCLASSLGFG